jgi:hypothetical protein
VRRQDFPLKGSVVSYVAEGSGELVGVELIRFDEAYMEVVESVEALRLATRYDVPALGLTEATLPDVLRRCHAEYVLTAKGSESDGRRDDSQHE